jgi:hypothetical protein
MFGLTLAAHAQFDIRLACAFQDRCLSCHRFVAAQYDLDVEWIQLEAAAASAGLFAGDERRSRTEEWVDDDVAAMMAPRRGNTHCGGRDVLEAPRGRSRQFGLYGLDSNAAIPDEFILEKKPRNLRPGLSCFGFVFSEIEASLII